MQELTITHKFSLVESIEFQIQLIIPKITRRQATMLAYMIVYPDTYKEKMIEDDVSTSKGAISARLAQMVDAGILEKNELGEKELLRQIKQTIQKESFIYHINIEINE